MRPVPTNPATLILLKVVEQNQQAAESTFDGLDNDYNFGDFGGDCSGEVHSLWN